MSTQSRRHQGLGLPDAFDSLRASLISRLMAHRAKCLLPRPFL